MLREAAYWHPDIARPPVSDMLADNSLSRYVEDWGRHGDLGLIAISEEGRSVGAAWLRLFQEDRPGYGFIDDSTLEMSIAIEPEFRGRGIGSGLIRALLHKSQQAGFQSVSLSVSAQNPALHLYERCGFQRLSLTDGSWLMRYWPPCASI